MTPEYAAGLFDGEGCVSLNLHIKRNGTPQYQLCVSVGGCYKPTIDALGAQFGGRVRDDSNYESRKGTKPFFNWRATGQDAVRFLEQIYPYSLEKATQVWLALEYRAQISRNRAGLTDSEIALREGFRLAIRSQKERRF